MCPQLPRLSPEYSHKAGLQTVITGMPLQIRPVTRGGHAGPVTMGRIARGPLSWARRHCERSPSQAFVWCRIERRVSLLVLSLSDQRLQRRPRAKGGVFAFAPTLAQSASRMSIEDGYKARSAGFAACVLSGFGMSRSTVGTSHSNPATAIFFSYIRSLTISRAARTGTAR
jgi:hypothetical protein